MATKCGRSAAADQEIADRRADVAAPRGPVALDRRFKAEVAEGVPAPMADALLGMYQAARRGDFAATDSTVEALLGRRPQTMRDVLAACVSNNSFGRDFGSYFDGSDPPAVQNTRHVQRGQPGVADADHEK